MPQCQCARFRVLFSTRQYVSSHRDTCEIADLTEFPFSLWSPSLSPRFLLWFLPRKDTPRQTLSLPILPEILHCFHSFLVIYSLRICYHLTFLVSVPIFIAHSSQFLKIRSLSYVSITTFNLHVNLSLNLFATILSSTL